MVREVDPKQTNRAAAYELWMKAPNPMVTFFKTVEITNLVRISRKKQIKLNLLLGWCIGRAAARSTSTPASVPLAFCLKGV